MRATGPDVEPKSRFVSAVVLGELLFRRILRRSSGSAALRKFAGLLDKDLCRRNDFGRMHHFDARIAGKPRFVERKNVSDTVHLHCSNEPGVVRRFA